MGIGNQLIGDLEQRLTTEVLRGRRLFRMRGASSHCWRAEKEIEQMYPGMRCLLLPSATIAFTLLLEVLKLEPGQEVLITPFGWLSNWSCIRRAGLVPRFLPLDDNLQLDPGQVGARISEKTGAMIVTHLMGRGQQSVGELAELCDKHGIPLLEDIAQSFGVSVQGRRAGTFGFGAWCSLNHHKLLSTGDGGFLLVKGGATLDKLNALHDQGCIMDNGKRLTHPNVEPGLSLRVTELMAAVLRAQLARFHLIRGRIQAHYRALSDAFSRNLNLSVIVAHQGDLPFTLLFRRPEHMNYPSLAESGWHVAPNVPWLAEAFADGLQADAALAETIANLATTSSLGTGFVDPYYATPLGLTITDSQADIPQIIQTLRTMQ